MDKNEDEAEKKGKIIRTEMLDYGSIEGNSNMVDERQVVLTLNKRYSLTVLSLSWQVLVHRKF
jgi:hypothetical protein